MAELDSLLGEGKYESLKLRGDDGEIHELNPHNGIGVPILDPADATPGSDFINKTTGKRQFKRLDGFVVQYQMIVP